MDSVCQICGQQFQGLNSNLKRHLLGHGELPFKCHICVKSFARSERNLRNTLNREERYFKMIKEYDMKTKFIVPNKYVFFLILIRHRFSLTSTFYYYDV